MSTVYENWSDFNSATTAAHLSSAKLPIPVVHIKEGAGKITEIHSNCFDNCFDFIITIEFDSGVVKKYSYNTVNGLGQLTIEAEGEAEISDLIDATINAWEPQADHMRELARIHAQEYLAAHKAELSAQLAEKKQKTKSFEKAKRKKADDEN